MYLLHEMYKANKLINFGIKKKKKRSEGEAQVGRIPCLIQAFKLRNLWKWEDEIMNEEEERVV
jgi:hypothetical protein